LTLNQAVLAQQAECNAAMLGGKMDELKRLLEAQELLEKTHTAIQVISHAPGLGFRG